MTKSFGKRVFRLFSLLALLIIVFCGTRLLIRALPGDPIEIMLNDAGSPLPAAELRAEFNLNLPLVPSLLADLKNVSRGDFGKSILTGQTIAPLLKTRFLKTLELSALATLFALAGSIALGVFAAAHPSGRADRFCSVYGAVTASLPLPWIGPILLLPLAIWLPLFPIGGNVFLPAFTLAISFSGLWARLVRERVRETLFSGGTTPAVSARARGLPEWKILLKYGLVPASGALIAYLGTQFGGLLAGAFVTEVIFDWQGMGALLLQAVLRRDYPVVEAAAFVAAAASLLGNFLGDWAQGAIDPRVSPS